MVWFSAVAMRADAGGSAQSAAPTEAALPPGDGVDVARRRCLTCHGSGLIAQQRLARDEWSRELDKMVSWGAEVIAPERPLLLDYLAGRFGKVPDQPPSSVAVTELLRMRCQVCHDRTLIDQQRLTLDGWRREIDKMSAWGAAVTEVEKAALAEHLASR